MNQTLRNNPSSRLRIAVLEDDQDLRERIMLPGLRDYGFVVSGAGSASELYRLMISQSFEIVVLDLGLPDEDGLSVARHLRSASASIGLIMLTGSRDRKDRIQALQESVDAFLGKPLDLDVLAATLHSLARRLQKTSPGTASTSAVLSDAMGWHLEAGGWRLIAPSQQLVALTAPEHCVLTLLMENIGTPVTRESLIQALTDNVYDFDPHRLEMMIHRLRKKVEKQVGESLPLVTARGTGYLFAGEVTR